MPSLTPDRHLEGLIAAPHTPMHADGGLDLAVVPRQVARLLADGVRGAFVCGTTGEGVSLTSDERRALLAAWVRSAPSGFRIIAHVGHCSQGEAVALACHALEAGAWAVASTAPWFFRPATAADAAAWCVPVAAAAAPLPFYYYHIPSMTGVAIPAHDVLAAALRTIPTLAGAKFTAENLHDFARCRALDPGLDIVFGRDEMLLAGLAMGARAAVGSTYNFAAPVYGRLMSAFARGDLDEARRQQAVAAALVVALDACGGLAAGKAMMRVIGVDCGPPRPPLLAVDAAGMAILERAAGAAGLARVS